jgi:hypothetical protein
MPVKKYFKKSLERITRRITFVSQPETQTTFYETNFYPRKRYPVHFNVIAFCCPGRVHFWPLVQTIIIG